jgi:hypothetical protein
MESALFCLIARFWLADSGVKGELFTRISCEVERERGDDDPWRDAFVHVTAADTLAVTAGPPATRRLARREHQTAFSHAGFGVCH